MTPEQAEILCRFVFDTGALLIWGAYGFLWLAVSKELEATIEHRLAWIYGTALMLVTLAGAGKIAAQAAMLDDGWQSVNPALAIEVLEATRSGAALGLQAGFALLLFLGYVLLPRHRGPVVTLLGLPLLISLSFSGHAAVEEGLLGLLHKANHSLHLVAAGLWLGGLAPVLLLLQAMADDTKRSEALKGLMRFSTIGHVAVAVTLLSGLLNSWLIISATRFDLNLAYQRLLVLKIAAVATMVAIALVNRYVFVPRMHLSPRQAVRNMQIGSCVEIALGLIAVALVAAFGTMAPG